jgi:hypothetical protein
MGENKGGDQRRKRTLIHTYDTYGQAERAAHGVIADGADPSSLQIRRRSNGFGLFRREAVK